MLSHCVILVYTQEMSTMEKFTMERPPSETTSNFILKDKSSTAQTEFGIYSQLYN